MALLVAELRSWLDSLNENDLVGIDDDALHVVAHSGVFRWCDIGKADLNPEQAIDAKEESLARLCFRNGNQLWSENSVQFPRLLAEIHAVGLGLAQETAIADSMDLEPDDLEVLFSRAEAAWNRIKQFTLPPRRKRRKE